MAKKFYSGEQKRDAGMIKEDWSAPCLLPRNVIDKDWSRTAYYMKMGEADLYMGVQKQLNEDANGMRKAMGPKKY